MAKKKAAKKVLRKRTVTEPTQGVVIGELVLDTVRLIETHSMIELVGGVIPSELATNIQSAIGANPEEKKVIVNSKVTLLTPAKDDKSPQSSLTLIVVAQCLFSVESVPDVSAIPPDEIKAIQQMALFISWPYIRQFVQASTASMSIPPTVLPLLRLQDQPK